MQGKWVLDLKPAKLLQSDKERVYSIVQQYIEGCERLKKIVSHINIKSGRIYLYYTFKPINYHNKMLNINESFNNEKKLELPIGRITLYDENGNKCTADWQRHNGKWVTLNKGKLEECVNFIDKNAQWFYGE